ncbi:MAG: TlpA family protein disulfide reductase [Stellaceae bacterium]
MHQATRSHSRRSFFFGGILPAALTLAMMSSVAFAHPKGKMGPTSAPAPRDTIAPDTQFHVGERLVDLKTYAGHKLMVWQVTTWCPSCRAGLATFADHQSLIDQSDVRVIVLRDYKNGGYPGVGIRKFAEEVAPKLLHDPHFVFGEDTKTLFDSYNPHHYVDVYQLITPDRHIAAASSTPSVTFDKIEAFIKSKPAS